jgi:predicted Zn-ribbon and HTH transcriptional regulator
VTRRDFDLVRRLEAVERALGLPRRVPLLVCRECTYEVAELRGQQPTAPKRCPECGLNALAVSRIVTWPPGCRPWWSADFEGLDDAAA